MEGGRISFLPTRVNAFRGRIQCWKFKPDGKYNDLVKILSDFEPILNERLEQLMNSGVNSFKLQVSLLVYYVKKPHAAQAQAVAQTTSTSAAAAAAATTEQPPVPFTLYLTSSNYLIWSEIEIHDAIPTINREILLRNDNAVHRESSIIIDHVDSITVNISRFQPLSGYGFKPLPEFLQSKRAIVNVQNRDNRCFGYAILSALFPVQQNPHRPQAYHQYFQQIGLHAIDYPVTPDQIPRLEEQLNLRINVFTFFDDEGKGRHPLYISKQNAALQEIDLLYWNEHYAWIKNFSAFIQDLSPGHNRKHFCKRCFGIFLTDQSYHRHIDLCNRSEQESILYSFPAEGTLIKFQNIKHQILSPFVIFADFESLLQPKAEERGAKQRRTKLYQEHIPSAVGVYLVSAYESLFPSQYATYTGPDVVVWFLEYVLDLTKRLKPFLEINQLLVMTQIDIAAHETATICWLCGQAFEDTQNLSKVRDHNHMTGKYRGAAHMICNIQLQQEKRIPIFFHNLRGYDAHLITLFLDKFPKEKIHLIAQGYEKYLMLCFGRNIVFKDSFQFLGYSLDSLAAELLRSGEDRFVHMKKQFPDINDNTRRLLYKKGKFPYEYMDSWERFEEPALPPMEKFDSTLRQSKCTLDEYTFAQTVWNEFNCQTLKDYQDLYLKTDVLLLADIFENFRKFSMQHYQLDPAYYVSSPQLSWDAMLLYTQAQIGLIHDPEMFHTIDRGIRGGVAMITHRYAKANNPEMGTDYDPNQELSYIVYLDANNLYGWAMSQLLPIDEFTWVSPQEWENIDWTQLSDEADYGYVIECDLNYPQHLHDSDKDYPLAPERKLIEWEKFSDTQLRILQHYSIPSNSLNTQKLIPHFLPRKNYVLHYRNLKYYLRHGLELDKIHKVIRFRQKKWLAPYIKKNQNLRAAAKSDFEKSQPKLYNNSIYGKTCENQKKRTNIQLARNDNQCKRLIEKPQMRGFKIFTKQLAAVSLRKLQSKIDKPFIVGFTVLELSKLLMYQFHYDYIKEKFGDSAQLLFTDTDSLMYHIRGCNPYEQFYKDRKEYFDFASFPRNHKYFDSTNNKVIGMFSDEANGYIILEFVGLRPKMYSYIIYGRELIEKNRAKGIQYQVAQKLKHADFLEQLNNPTENRMINRRIGSKLHRLYTIEVNKRGLCAFDDKRILLEDGITSLPYGHYAVTADIIDIEGDFTIAQNSLIDQARQETVDENHEEIEHELEDLIAENDFS